MTGSFTKKRIRITFYLGRGKEASLGYDKVVIDGLRCEALLAVYAGQAMGEAHCRIWGLSLSLINKIAAVMPAEVYTHYDRVTIEAGDDETGLALLFSGGLREASADFTAPTEAILSFSAYAAMFEAVKPAAALSYPSAVDLAQVAADIAKSAEWAFENNGVSVLVQSPNFPGTALEQIRACAMAGDFDYVLDRGTLAISPKGQGRTTMATVTLSPETGMVGYPAFTGGSIGLLCLLNPSIQPLCKVKVQSILTTACGEWVEMRVQHEISAEMPGGPWFTRIQGVRNDINMQPRS